MIYYIFKSIKGERELYASTEDKAYAVELEDKLRKELRSIDNDGAIMDCYIRTDEQLKAERSAADRWERLTEEEKKETVTIDGRKYVKAILREQVKEIRKKTGLTQAAFSKKYGMPKRTLENWEGGINTPAPWIIALLERVVEEDFS